MLGHILVPFRHYHQLGCAGDDGTRAKMLTRCHEQLLEPPQVKFALGTANSVAVVCTTSRPNQLCNSYADEPTQAFPLKDAALLDF